MNEHLYAGHVLFKAGVKNRVVIRSVNRDKMFDRSGTAIKKRLTVGKRDNMVEFGMNDQQWQAAPGGLVNIAKSFGFRQLQLDRIHSHEG